MDIRNIIIGIGILVIAGLIYLGVVQHRKIASQDNLIVAANDTLHKFKTSNGNQGAYIATLVGDKQGLISILQLKDKADSTYKQVIDSLKKDKNLQSIAIVNTDTKSNYTHKIDTVYKDINFKDSISTKWYDASINVNKGNSTWEIDQRDELSLTNTLKPNKGLFSGKTLTTYATSNNPDTDVTGVTSVSTVIDKSKITIRPAIGIGINSDIHGSNIRVGYNAGIVVTFK